MKTLSSLSLIEFSENNPNIVWKGPDFFNLLGFCKEDIDSVKENPGRLLNSFHHYLENFSDEIFNREISFYKYILRKHIEPAEFDLLFAGVPREGKGDSGPEFGYAMLKGKTLTHYIRKPRVIIGRSSKNRYG